MSYCYKLTAKARALRWREWRRRGGCGLSDYARFFVDRVYGPENRCPPGLTLGEIAEVSPPAERELARYGWENPSVAGEGFATPQPIPPPRNAVGGAR